MWSIQKGHCSPSARSVQERSDTSCIRGQSSPVRAVTVRTWRPRDLERSRDLGTNIAGRRCSIAFFVINTRHVQLSDKNCPRHSHISHFSHISHISDGRHPHRGGLERSERLLRVVLVGFGGV